jgi:hypothetical protein
MNRLANVIYFGSDYEGIPMKNIYKALNLVRPDIVLLQMRPDLLLDNFKFD